MGRQITFWGGFGRAVMLCAGLGFVLGGCAVQKPETGSPKPELTEVKIPSPEDFTTVGKPTKTIKKLGGPVEIYDPTQDPEVRAVFGRIYTKGDQNLLISDQAGDLGDKLDVYSPDVRILRRALKLQRENYARKGCRIISTSECGSWWQIRGEADCLKNSEKDCSMSMIRAQANISGSCAVAGVLVYNRAIFPIGTHFLDNNQYRLTPSNSTAYPLPTIHNNQNEQFQNFFATACYRWKSNQGE